LPTRGACKPTACRTSPDPSPSGNISISGQPHGNSPAARANDACEHLLAAGSAGTGGATAPATASPAGATATDCLGSLPCYDQEAGHPLGFVNPAIYRIARGPQYHQAFHDITAGNNTAVLSTASAPVTITGYQADPAGTRSPAGGRPTPRSSSPCWPAEAPRWLR
jgi:hypothetical protein